LRDYQFIVIEGVIGVGKTSLALLLAKRLKAKLVLERHEENPFLVDFYKDPKRYAFQTEMFFLLSRYKQQLDEFSQPDLFEQLIIADYHFLKNRIFAHLTLEEREYNLYDRVISALEPTIVTPDLVVYLQSNVERLMQNIRQRDREYERNIQPKYIQILTDAYNYFFARYTASPLLIVNSTKLDFVQHPRQFEVLLEQIQQAPEGVSRFDPDLDSE